MIQIIAGEKGKGKTKILLDKVNADISNAKGTIAYIDKNNKHMYELSNKIRLMDISDYFIESSQEFTGFISGILSQDHDLEKIYLDSFLTISSVKPEEMESVFAKLEKISANFKTDFVISVSMCKDKLPESVKPYVIVSL